MTKMIFVNLPVTDLAASTRFYEALGFGKNDMFSDGNASSMVWSDAITIMLLTHEHFQSFAPRPIADAQAVCQVLIALSCDSREDVDAMAAAAGATGGTPDVRDPNDMGFMYGRAFADPDGHVIEAVWMDMSALAEADAG